MQISEDFLNELRARCDIENVISQYVVLKRHGKSLKGLCPFHSEKTPSFNVSSDKQLFYCFGCGAGGDVITFIMKAENLSYPEAVAFLAEKVGLQVPEKGVDDGAMRLKNRILEINRETARFFHAALKSPQGASALAYIKDRGLTDKTITRFGIGYAPDSWDSLIRHLRKKGYTDAEMSAAGVTTRTKNGNLIDFFRNRLMFPIIDVRGNVIAFGGRRLDNEKGYKYLNTGETAVFVKNRNLYALNYAKSSQFAEGLAKSGKDRFLILCEGYMDVIALHQAGFDNAVAPLGTALTDNQVRIMSKYVSSIVIATDSDEAGQKAAKRSYELIDAAGLNTKILKIQGAKDPDEYIKKYGSTRFAGLLTQSVSAAQNEFDAILAKHDTETDQGKVAALKEACEVLSKISNPIERDVYISRISGKLSVSKEAVLQSVNSLIRKNQNAQKKKERQTLSVAGSGIRDTVNPEKRKLLSAAVCEEWLLGSLFGHPDFLNILKKEEISGDDFITEWGKRTYRAIVKAAEESQTLDLMAMGALVTPDEMSRLAEISVKGGSNIRTREQFYELISTLRSEKQKERLSGENVKQMDDKALSDLIEKLSKDKK